MTLQAIECSILRWRQCSFWESLRFGGQRVDGGDLIRHRADPIRDGRRQAGEVRQTTSEEYRQFYSALSFTIGQLCSAREIVLPGSLSKISCAFGPLFRYSFPLTIFPVSGSTSTFSPGGPHGAEPTELRKIFRRIVQERLPMGFGREQITSAAK